MGRSKTTIFDETFYFRMLTDFQNGVRFFKVNGSIFHLCRDGVDENIELQVDQCLPQVAGKIVNFSVGTMALSRFVSRHARKPENMPPTVFFWWHITAVQKRLLIKSAGNEGMLAGSGFMFAFFKSFASHPSTCNQFINVTNLNIDGLHPNPTSVLPGRHADLQQRTISAIGTDIEVLDNSPQDSIHVHKESGTSFSAPFVSAVASIIEDQFPNLSTAEIGHCILDSATPIILLGQFESFLEPVALDMMACELIGPGEYRDVEGNVNKVTEEMIEKSRETYGMGRVHVERALQLASLLSHAKPHPDLAEIVAERNYDEIEDILLLA